MRNKLSFIFITILTSMFFFSCNRHVKVTESYYQIEKPGRKGLESHTAFVIHFSKPTKKEVTIKELTVMGYNGNDYHFSDLVLSDSSLNKTLIQNKGLKAFALYLNTGKASKVVPSKEQQLSAKVIYSDCSEEKQLVVTSFKDNGIKTRR